MQSNIKILISKKKRLKFVKAFIPEPVGNKLNLAREGKNLNAALASYSNHRIDYGVGTP